MTEGYSFSNIIANIHAKMGIGSFPFENTDVGTNNWPESLIVSQGSFEVSDE